MTGSPSRRPLSTISRLNPWRANGPRRTSWKFLVASRCYISNFRSLGCQEAHQEGPYPPSPGWILGGLMVPDTLTGGSRVACRCYISNFRCLGCQEAHQEGSYPPSPGWILGGQMVPDVLPGGSWWPGGATFQISGVWDVRKPIKNAPIHHLQVGSMEDRWFITLFLGVPGGQEVANFKQVVKMKVILHKVN